MLLSHFHKKNQRRIAWVMFYSFILQMGIQPNGYALTSGPVQPEAHGFEPVGTTDMVDPFTGDFVYNIPLMDVEGYPINIAYHGGVGLDQEASWVGLGWNITPGAVNRSMRGLPDDFDGDTVAKEINIKKDKTLKVGLGVAAELFGGFKFSPNVTAGINVNINNYRGVSLDLNAGLQAGFKTPSFSGGLNSGISIGSQTGAAINYGAEFGASTASVLKNCSAGANFNANINGVYNPRTGIRKTLGLGAGASTRNGRLSLSGGQIPIGVQNYTSVISNSSYMNSYSGQVKFGGEVLGLYPNLYLNCGYFETNFKPNGDLKGYGYLNLDHADNTALLDFSRDKDMQWNSTMHYLPQSTLTYDVYNVSGQGTGGSFRPFRNDIGSVFDPNIHQEENKNDNVNLEFGLGGYFEIGADYTNTITKSSVGPWENYYRSYKGARSGSYEDVYFKQGGELTENNETYLNHSSGNTALLTPDAAMALPLEKVGASNRVVRSNYIYAISGKDLDSSLLLDSKALYSYNSNGFASFPNINRDTIKRVDPSNASFGRRAHHITEIVQVQKDGRKYIYGLPVVNNVQREAVFAINNNNVDSIARSTNLVNYTKNVDDNMSNTNGLDNFYSSSITPTYTTANLLTGVLSNDYIDITGDGISDDDLGSYTKFNYSRKSKDYRWRSPAQKDKASYIPAYFSDKQDDKAVYLIGSREQWYLHSVESKNYVAEFYVSPREDAKGVLEAVLGTSTTATYQNPVYKALNAAGDNQSYKLDSIVLYNKHDRFLNGALAKAIKAVYFSYDYSLCPGVPNSTSGKLTLKAIQFKFGDSKMNLSAPYTFNYTNNYAYHPTAKDRWDMYKPNLAGIGNTYYPFTEQSANTNNYAKAWSLSDIGLPSGGIIKVDYEADDYAFVQEKRAMEMFKVDGFGNSASFSTSNQLYYSSDQPCLYVYFTRRKTDENPNLSFNNNYLKESALLYYNIPVQLKPGCIEAIKGYASITEMGACSDNIHGYLKMEAKNLENSAGVSSPIVYTALNTGRYNLPHILFPGQDPDLGNFKNVMLGLENSFKDLLNIFKNPIKYYMQQNMAKNADVTNGFIRLNTPGLKKKGGGQRVKSIRFFDNWASMAKGNQAIYGKVYDYSMLDDDGKSVISSGVASWEPTTGGDENPHRVPVYYNIQQGVSFPPNDPVELFQENPIGESFFPSAVVGYRKVSVRSINFDQGRSSQSEDLHYFYTAKDFPIITSASGLNATLNKDYGIKGCKEEATAKQGFSIQLNDMHGKPMNTEHWVLKKDTVRELVSFQKQDYFSNAGQLSNVVPTYVSDPQQGSVSVVNKVLGVETDVTIDSRANEEVSETDIVGANLNVIPFFGLPAPFPTPSFGHNKFVKSFKAATVTKITQQYGILSKVTNFNQGANTELRNEVFDPKTGNVLVSSINNEFGDREYSATYPAYWAYKELGPVYETQNIWDSLPQPLKIDSLGIYANRFVNYNTAFSASYKLPSNMPVGRMLVNEQMPKFGLGDELLLYLSGLLLPPTRVWVMGYTSDLDNCYVVLAPREPYALPADAAGLWALGNTLNPATSINHLTYRIVKSGRSNRTGETIQTLSTIDKSNLIPNLKNDFTNVMTLEAQRYSHQLNQVSAAHTTSDSLNPYVTGKVGLYRQEMELLNIKKRNYATGLSRTAGLFDTKSYWQIEKDNYASYCPDSLNADFMPFEYSSNNGVTFSSILKKLSFSKIGNAIKIDYETDPNITGAASPEFIIDGWKSSSCASATYPSYYTNMPGYNAFSYSPNTPSNSSSFTISNYFLLNSISYNTCVNSRPNGAHMTIKVKTGGGIFYLLNFYIEYIGQGVGNDFAIQFIGFNNCAILGSMPDPIFKDSYAIANACRSSIFYSLGYYKQYATPFRVNKKIQLGIVGHYDGADQENWVAPQRNTKYNSNGIAIENCALGLGYTTAIHGYNEQLPICVAKNARHSEVLFEGFEDYNLLRIVPSKRAAYLRLSHSPFAPYFDGASVITPAYKKANLQASFTSATAELSKEATHSGEYALKVSSGTALVPLQAEGPSFAKDYSFALKRPITANDSEQIILSLWLKPIATSTTFNPSSFGTTIAAVVNIDATQANLPSTPYFPLLAKTSIIEGWQKYEVLLSTKVNSKLGLQLPSGYYYDDIRITPFAANSKAFVYDLVSRQLNAQLDENNFATYYEYDAEGNLIRTKKETEQGIITIAETRSAHKKN